MLSTLDEHRSAGHMNTTLATPSISPRSRSEAQNANMRIKSSYRATNIVIIYKSAWGNPARAIQFGSTQDAANPNHHRRCHCLWGRRLSIYQITVHRLFFQSKR